MSEVTLTAYNVKTKEKGVPIKDAVITKTAKGAYMAQGNDGKGNKLTTLLGAEKALAAIEAGIATPIETETALRSTRFTDGLCLLK